MWVRKRRKEKGRRKEGNEGKREREGERGERKGGNMREGEEERGEGEGCICLKYQYTLLQRPASPSTCRMSI